MNEVEEVNEWILNFVEKAFPEFGDFPVCPFAKKARLNGEITVELVRGDLEEFICSKLEDYDYNIKLSLIIETDLEKYSTEVSEELHERLKAIAEKKNIIVLMDHPEIEDYHNELKVNQGKYLLIFLQPYDTLLEYRKKALKMGYFDNWTEERIKDVIEDKWNDVLDDSFES